MKSTISRLFALLMLVSMTLSLVNPFSAQPAQAAEVTAAAPVAQPSLAKIGESETGLYIIRLVDAALASYDGRLPTLDATSPSVTGAGKLDVTSETSVAYLDYLEGKHQQFITEMNSALGRSVEVVFQYKNVFNGLAVRVNRDEAQILAGLPGVKAVYADTYREPQTDIGPWWIGADDIWDGNIGSGVSSKGEGTIIGMIDSGLNHANPAFADIGPVDGYDHTNPYGAGVYHGVCDPAHPNHFPGFCNDKVISAFSFYPGVTSPEDTGGHGSHTASTAAGNMQVVSVTDTITRVISGVAPHANLAIYLVCSPSCPSTSSIAAVNQGITDSVDVLNYSISGGDDPWNDPVDLAFLDAFNAGIFVSASAGNQGPNPNTVAKTGPWNAAVAMATHPRLIANTLDVTDPFTPTLQGLAALQGNGPQLTAPLEKELSYDSANLSGCTAFTTGYFTDKLALIERGDCTFATKITNAFNAGAVGVVIFNNRPGPPAAMNVGTGNMIPSVMVGQGDGLDLKAYIDAHAPVTVRLNPEQQVIYNPDFADIIDSGSSRGPSDWEVLKPDYAAPGVNILAVVAASGGDPMQYAFYSGTSMAAPHGAGAAALLKSLNPTWSPAEIKSALQTTTYPWWLVNANTGSAIVQAKPFDTGSGRLNVGAAANAGLVFDETYAHYLAANPTAGGDPKTLNQPNLVNYSCVGSCSWTRTVRSVLPFPATYTVTFTSTLPMTVTATPSVFTINPGGTQDIVFTADVTALPTGVFAFGDVLFETDAIFPGTLLLSESFEDASFPPAGWAITVTGVIADPGWLQDNGTSPDLDFGPITPIDGSYFAWHNDDNTGGLNDSWLISPVFTPTAGTALSFFEDNYYTPAYYFYHGVLVSTNSCNPLDGDFVELQEFGANVNGWTQQTIDLSAYAGQGICIAFEYAGNYADEWLVDNIRVSVPGAPVSAQRLTTVIAPADAYIPKLVVIDTQQKSGVQVASGLQSITDVVTLTATVDGLSPATVVSQNVVQDPTNGNPFNGDGGTIVQLINVPAGALRLVAEILASDSQDVDLFVGTGSTPGANILCTSATSAVLEYCDLDNPVAGTYWVLAQNWLASAPSAADNITLSVGAVVPGDAGNLLITGPISVTATTPFDINLNWDEPALAGVDAWYGVVTLGTQPSMPDNLGLMRVNLHYTQPVYLSKAAPAQAYPGDVITYTIVIDGNGAPINGSARLTDTLPAGVEFAGGITATFGTATYDSGDNAVYWSNGLKRFESVLWNQPLSSTNTNAYAAQNFSDYPAYSIYFADDFTAAGLWTIDHIFVPGNGWNGFTTLANATALNWKIYADDGGLPAGDPSGAGAPPVWSLSLPPTDTQVTLTNGVDGMPSDVMLTLATPFNLPPGTYWLSFYPTMAFAVGGQYGFHVSDTNNGYEGQLINPGGGFGWPSGWQSFSAVSMSAHDAAFRLEGAATAIPEIITITFDVTVTAVATDVVNTAELLYNGDIFDASATTTTPNDVTFVYHDLEDVVAVGEDVALRGDFNGWNDTLMTPNGDYSVFTATVFMFDGSYGYKYYMPDLPDWQNYDMLNTANRSVTVTTTMTVNDYRKVNVGWAHLGDPITPTILLGDNSGNLVGEVYIQNVTNPAGEGRGIKAQLGYGADPNPATWTWVDMTYTGDNFNNDLFAAVITPTAVGTYTFGVRFDGNWGVGNPDAGWTYGDRTGVLTVLPVGADVALDKAGPNAVSGGGLITYTLTITNNGPADATGVVVTDTLPAGVTFVLASVGCDEDSGVVVCNVGTLANGGEITITIVVTAPQSSGSLSNTAEVFAENDDNLLNNSDLVVTDLIWYKLYLPLILKVVMH